MIWPVLGLAATCWYALDEWVAVRRNRSCAPGMPRGPRVFWCAAYGAIIAGGMVLIVESRWYAIPLVLGAALGAWPDPE